MKNRSSYHLSQLQKEPHKRATRETDEDTRRDYWPLYYKAVNAEHEVRVLVMDAEIRHLLEFALAYGYLPDHLADEIDSSDDKAKPAKPPAIDNGIDEDDIPLRQKGLWDE
ncbi:MAG: hypothetical protein Q9P01_16630 [Anaerolineae bacterium]|nr:hypothetical protein [Anaerolineae bacterium]MDQ7036391.1 hypothetical protein [Anaerolineae bacterium]